MVSVLSLFNHFITFLKKINIQELILVSISKLLFKELKDAFVIFNHSFKTHNKPYKNTNNQKCDTYECKNVVFGMQAYDRHNAKYK